MKQEEIDAFAANATELQTAVDALVADADGLRDQIDALQLLLSKCNRTVATLRRTDNADMMGPLNSLSAAKERHQSLAGALTDLEAALARFEDVGRDLRLLQPSVVGALQEKLAAKAAPADVAPVVTEKPA